MQKLSRIDRGKYIRDKDASRHQLWKQLLLNGIRQTPPVLDELVKKGVDIAAVQRDFAQPMVHEENPSMSADQSRKPAVAAFIRDPAGTLIELITP